VKWVTRDDDQAASLIVLDFTVTAADLLKVMRFTLRKIVRQRFSVACGGIITICGVVLLVGRSRHPLPGILLLCLGLGYLALMPALYEYAIRRGVRRAMDNDAHRHVEISDNGVRICSSLSDTLNQWPVYSQLLDWQEFYLLRRGRSRTYLSIPKRAFASKDEENAFAVLVARHVAVTDDAKSTRLR